MRIRNVSSKASSCVGSVCWFAYLNTTSRSGRTCLRDETSYTVYVLPSFLTFLLQHFIRLNRSKKQGAYGRVPTIKAGTLAQLSHIDEVTQLRSFCVEDFAGKKVKA